MGIKICNVTAAPTVAHHENGSFTLITRFRISSSGSGPHVNDLPGSRRRASIRIISPKVSCRCHISPMRHASIQKSEFHSTRTCRDHCFFFFSRRMSHTTEPFPDCRQQISATTASFFSLTEIAYNNSISNVLVVRLR